MKYIKIFRTLAVALTLALLAAAIPATPALALGYLELSPNHDEIGEHIDVYGNYFNASASVYIYFSSDDADEGDSLDDEVNAYEGVRTATTSDDGDFVTYFNVPDELTDGDDEETVRGGTYYVYATYYGSKIIRAKAKFTVESAGNLALDPDDGTVGTEVEVTGEDFDDEEDITVEYDDDEVDIASGDEETDNDGEFELTIIIPESTAGDHTITVIGDDSEIEAEATFSVEPKITITPESGTAGDTITVSGTGFGERVDFSIFFDDYAVIEDETTGRQGSFTVSFTASSWGPGRYDLEAEDEDDNSDQGTFTIAAAAASISPTTGYVGTEVAASGTGFQASKPIGIYFDSTTVATVSSDSYGSFSTSFNVPVYTAGTYTVTISDGINTVASYFNIELSASISPTTSAASPGHVGTPLTVSGVGFTAGGTVTITYDGNQIATTTVNTDGSFSASLNAPAGSGGNHTIIASDGTNTQQFTFVMESTPPSTPLPLKPEMGVKAEAEAYFDWEDVDDPSLPVTYTLQIATDEEFSEDSIVLEKTGLTQSEYAIPAEEKLNSVSKEAPYYWHVKAVDGTSAESLWSGTGWFYIGFSFAMSQTIIYLLFGVGALLLAIFAFWMGRKTAYC